MANSVTFRFDNDLETYHFIDLLTKLTNYNNIKSDDKEMIKKVLNHVRYDILGDSYYVYMNNERLMKGNYQEAKEYFDSMKGQTGLLELKMRCPDGSIVTINRSKRQKLQ